MPESAIEKDRFGVTADGTPVDRYTLRTPRGTIVQVGVMGGGSTTFNLAALMPKRARLVGTVLRARPLDEKIAVSQRFAAEVVPLFESGALRPVIDRRYALDDIAGAHAYMETNANVGKIVIAVAPTA